MSLHEFIFLTTSYFLQCYAMYATTSTPYQVVEHLAALNATSQPYGPITHLHHIRLAIHQSGLGLEICTSWNPYQHIYIIYMIFSNIFQVKIGDITYPPPWNSIVLGVLFLFSKVPCPCLLLHLQCLQIPTAHVMPFFLYISTHWISFQSIVAPIELFKIATCPTATFRCLQGPRTQRHLCSNTT